MTVTECFGWCKNLLQPAQRLFDIYMLQLIFKIHPKVLNKRVLHHFGGMLALKICFFCALLPSKNDQNGKGADGGLKIIFFFKNSFLSCFVSSNYCIKHLSPCENSKNGKNWQLSPPPLLTWLNVLEQLQVLLTLQFITTLPLLTTLQSLMYNFS